MTSIRPIEHEDLAAVVAILVAGSLTENSEQPDNLDRYWRAVEETRDRGGDVLVADDGEIVGVTQVLVFRHLQRGGGQCCELESVHVRADRRGQGIGAQLLEAAESLARDRGCYRIQLTSNNVRHDAHRFYLAHGYEASHQGFKKLL